MWPAPLSRLLSRLARRQMDNLLGSALIVIAVLVGGLGLALLAALAVTTLSLAFSLLEGLFEARQDRARHCPAAVSPTLERSLADLAQAAHLPLPRLVVSDAWGTRISAAGLRRRQATISLEGGALQCLSLLGLRGMLAHELGHIARRDVPLAVTSQAILTLLTRLQQALLFALALGLPILPGLLWITLALALPILANLGQNALLRTQETRADAFAVALVGPRPLIAGLSELEGYEQALCRLTTAMERANPVLLPHRLASLARGTTLDAETVEVAQRLLDMEQEVSHLYHRPAPPQAVLEEAHVQLSALLIIVPPEDGDPGSLRRLHTRLSATHTPHERRVAALAEIAS